jgi:hypothetical protein
MVACEDGRFSMKVGDRVTMSKMWKHNDAKGEIVKITKDYIVISWDDVNGEWHYTLEQSKRIEVMNEAHSMD